MSSDNKNKWYKIARAELTEKTIAEVLIYEVINAYGTAADFVSELKSYGSVSEIVIRINSPGGAVYDGLAIYNYLKQQKTPVTIYIDGIAASMASIITMAGDTIIIPSNAYLFIHNPRGVQIGDARAMEKYAKELDHHSGALAQIYAQRTGLPLDNIRRMMDEETLLTGAQAVELGFADILADAVEIAAQLNFPDGAVAALPDKIQAIIQKQKEFPEMADDPDKKTELQLTAAAPAAAVPAEPPKIEPSENNLQLFDPQALASLVSDAVSSAVAEAVRPLENQLRKAEESLASVNNELGGIKASLEDKNSQLAAYKAAVGGGFEPGVQNKPPLSPQAKIIFANLGISETELNEGEK